MDLKLAALQRGLEPGLEEGHHAIDIDRVTNSFVDIETDDVGARLRKRKGQRETYSPGPDNSNLHG